MDVMKQLAETGETIQQCDDYRTELVAKRTEQVQQARAEGHTWREIAGVLNMTEHGLIKASRR